MVMLKRLFVLCMSLVLLTGGCPACSMDSEAASKNAKAKKAYAKVLSSEKAAEGIIDTSWGLGKNTEFALLDINKDGVSELIFTPDGGYHVDIVSYIKGKVKNVGWGFSGSQKYYPNKHIYYSQTTHSGDDVYTYYKFTGKKMKVVAEKYGNDHINAVTGKAKPQNKIYASFAPYEYTVNGKRVSAKKYKAYVKKLLSGAKSKKLKWHKNTAKNRKKYL